MNKFCTYCMSPMGDGPVCQVCGLDPSSYTAAVHHLPVGTMLKERYLIGRVLGEGGFGVTYIGRDLNLDSKVAIKEYFPKDKASRNTSTLRIESHSGDGDNSEFEHGKERFRKEARSIAQLEKDKVAVGVRDFIEENNTAYIVMEFIEGTTLSKLTELRGGRMQPDELFRLIEPLFDALGGFHEHGLVHRDISPDNIMLEKGKVRLLDFGCAKDASAQGNETSSVALKYDYAPVELYTSTGHGAWSDIYSLGATVYFCLTGNPPPRAFDRMINDTLVPPRQLGVPISAGCEAALMRSLALKAADRQQTVAELKAGLYADMAAAVPNTMNGVPQTAGMTGVQFAQPPMQNMQPSYSAPPSGGDDHTVLLSQEEQAAYASQLSAGSGLVFDERTNELVAANDAESIRGADLMIGEGGELRSSAPASGQFVQSVIDEQYDFHYTKPQIHALPSEEEIPDDVALSMFDRIPQVENQEDHMFWEPTRRKRESKNEMLPEELLNQDNVSAANIIHRPSFYVPPGVQRKQELEAAKAAAVAQAAQQTAQQTQAPNSQYGGMPAAPSAQVPNSQYGGMPAAPSAQVPNSQYGGMPAAPSAQVPNSQYGGMPAAPSAQVPNSQYGGMPAAPSAQVPHSQYEGMPAAPSAQAPNSQYGGMPSASARPVQRPQSAQTQNAPRYPEARPVAQQVRRQSGGGKKKGIIIGVSAAAALALIITAIVLNNKNGSDVPADTSEPAATTAAPGTTPAPSVEFTTTTTFAEEVVDIEQTDAKLFETVEEDGGITVTKYTGESGEVSIPPVIDGKPVRKIQGEEGKSIFPDPTAITLVELPAGISEIGSCAFIDCSNLGYVAIPNSVTKVGESAFEGCSSLRSARLPDGVARVEDKTFLGCSTMSAVSVPSTVTEIGEQAFSGCSSLRAVKFPNGLRVIGASAFEECSALTEAKLPKSVSFVGNGAFRDCSGIEKLILSAGMSAITEECFDGCSSIASLTVPNNITKIGDKAFAGCAGMTEASLPADCDVADSAFEGCSADIKYRNAGEDIIIDDEPVVTAPEPDTTAPADTTAPYADTAPGETTAPAPAVTTAHVPALRPQSPPIPPSLRKPPPHSPPARIRSNMSA